MADSVGDARHPSRAGRVLLVIAGCALALWLLGVALLLLQVRAGAPLYEYWLETTLSELLLTPVGLVLLRRRPEHRLSWLFGGFIVVGGVQLCTGAAATGLADSAPHVAVVFALIHDVVQLSFVVLLLTLVLLYPSGQLLSRRLRPVAWLLWGGGALSALSGLLAPRVANFPALHNPLGSDAPIVGWIQLGSAVMTIAGIAGAIVSVIFRYRRSVGIERLQMRWFTFTVIVGTVLLAGLGYIVPEEGPWGSILWTVVPSSVLGSIGVAVVRYRLMEIDRIISRTASYAIISALLAALYALTMLVLTPLIAAVGGDSTIAIAAGTLLVAAAFGPVRRSVRARLDRRFNRARYDALRTVETFAGSLRDDVDLDQLSRRLVGAVSSTVAPQQVSLWLAAPGE